jgi:ABC-type dipeptide/oligopeptide/nickel transport system ATPase component
VAAEDPILAVRDLRVSFATPHGVRPILEGIGFDLQPGEILGVVGESGSGKSVTARVLLGLIPSPPLQSVSGTVRYAGQDLLPYDPRRLQAVRGKEIGLIFQEPMTALNPVLTIGEQIAEMLRVHEKASRAEARRRAKDLLAEVGIAAPELRMGSYPHELSGGMRQRAMIAMALSCAPRILIADEPTTALDVTVQAQILELFTTLNQKRGMALIFITHDLRVIAEVAQRVLVMRAGKVVEQDDVARIFHAPRSDDTRRLLALIQGVTP